MAYTGNSIVDYLKSVGQNSSYSSRSKLATQYGISGYKGTSQQNLKLLSLLRSGTKPAATTTAVKAAPAVTTQVKATAPKAVSPSTAAYNNLQTIINNKPGEYAPSPYAQQVTDVLNQIKGRSFSYDFNVDPLYQTAKNNYMEQGQKAMLDTMGNAAALTGGYGNSYATTAGQQTYQDNLSQINNVIPELYNAAYSKYSDKGNKLMQELELANTLEQQNYNKYLDKISNWNTDYQTALGVYNDERDIELQQQQAAAELAAANAKASSSSSSSGTKSLSASTMNSIIKKVEGFEDNASLSKYLDSLVDSGTLSESQADNLYIRYKKSETTAKSYSSLSDAFKGLGASLAAMR